VLTIPACLVSTPLLPLAPTPAFPAGLTLGIALTEHCNLRCPHCIRDDVLTVRSLAPELVLAAIDDARRASAGPVVASFTGGEPLLHPAFGALVAALRARDVPWRVTTNGWHFKRLAAHLDAAPAQLVRLSLSGATAATHDADRGRGSFERVLRSLMVCTSRRIPTAFSFIIDTRTHGELDAVAALAASLGVQRLHYILPQPVPGSVARGSDLPPSAWAGVRDRVHTIATAAPLAVQLDYGAPVDGPEPVCDTLAGGRLYIDARGQLSDCCQLSEYGEVESDVVGSLEERSLAEWLPTVVARRDALAAAQAKRHDPSDGLDPFPCLRCARATGKLAWLAAHPDSPWHTAAFGARDGAGAAESPCHAVAA
jgi:MoaA/NifB/PqqE/SkfB family radical SAM enzyme